MKHRANISINIVQIDNGYLVSAGGGYAIEGGHVGTFYPTFEEVKAALPTLCDKGLEASVASWEETRAQVEQKRGLYGEGREIIYREPRSEFLHDEPAMRVEAPAPSEADDEHLTADTDERNPVAKREEPAA